MITIINITLIIININNNIIIIINNINIHYNNIKIINNNNNNKIMFIMYGYRFYDLSLILSKRLLTLRIIILN